MEADDWHIMGNILVHRVTKYPREAGNIVFLAERLPRLALCFRVDLTQGRPASGRPAGMEEVPSSKRQLAE